MDGAESPLDVLSPDLAPSSGAARWPWDGRAFDDDVLPERVERPAAAEPATIRDLGAGGEASSAKLCMVWRGGRAGRCHERPVRGNQDAPASPFIMSSTSGSAG